MASEKSLQEIARRRKFVQGYHRALREIANTNCMIGWKDYPGCIEAADAGELTKEASK